MLRVNNSIPFVLLLSARFFWPYLLLTAVYYYYCRREQPVLLDQGFRQAYAGSAPTRFMDFLETCERIYDPHRHFGRVVPILQSGASGKSRLVKELSAKVSTAHDACVSKTFIWRLLT